MATLEEILTGTGSETPPDTNNQIGAFTSFFAGYVQQVY